MATAEVQSAQELHIVDQARPLGRAVVEARRELALPLGMLAAVVGGVNAPDHPRIATAVVVAGFAAYGVAWIRGRRD